MARDTMRRIDDIMASTKDEGERQKRYLRLKQEIEDATRSTLLPAPTAPRQRTGRSRATGRIGTLAG